MVQFISLNYCYNYCFIISKRSVFAICKSSHCVLLTLYTTPQLARIRVACDKTKQNFFVVFIYLGTVFVLRVVNHICLSYFFLCCLSFDQLIAIVSVPRLMLSGTPTARESYITFPKMSSIPSTLNRHGWMTLTWQRHSPSLKTIPTRMSMLITTRS